MILPMICSDHHPIRLRATNHVHIGPHSFYFQDMWTHHHDFSTFVRTCWTLPIHAANPALCLMAKLKRLKGKLRTWNANVFRNVFNEIQLATEALDATQQKISTEGDSDELFDEEMNRIATLNGLLARRHAMLSQKNRLLWLKDGDINSVFFHRMHCTRKSRTSIKMVQVGNFFITLESDIRLHVVNYYKKLFAKDDHSATDFQFLENFDWAQVSEDQNSLLTTTPSQEEVRLAIFSLDSASSPGPDGFGG